MAIKEWLLVVVSQAFYRDLQEVPAHLVPPFFWAKFDRYCIHCK